MATHLPAGSAKKPGSHWVHFRWADHWLQRRSFIATQSLKPNSPPSQKNRLSRAR